MWPCVSVAVGKRCVARRMCAGLIVLASVTPIQQAWAADKPNRLLVESNADEMLVVAAEQDKKAPVDIGFGPGVKAPAASKNRTSPAAAGPVQTPRGPSNAHTTGVFGPEFGWPIIPIHAVLVPTGQVMSYGTNQLGQQGAQYFYDVWEPALGTDANAHNLLPNTTPTDLFCSGQTLMWTTGNVLLTGGDQTVNGQRNYPRPDTNLFTPSTNALTQNTPMHYPRWYDTPVALPNGDVLVLGGRTNRTAPQYATVPELFNPATGWTALTGAASSQAFSYWMGWYYPQAMVIPNGKVFQLGFTGHMFLIDPTGTGAITTVPSMAPAGNYGLPSVQFSPGKLLAIRNNSQVVIVDATSGQPVITPTANIDQVRYWANGTVLADGTVLVTGGSAGFDTLQGVDYTAEMWNPATGQWTAGANAAVPRLYHSIALLMPDGSVLTGGGGSPGPLKNLNGEIFYPPYLYANDGSGNPAVRPTIEWAPPRMSLSWPWLLFAVGQYDRIGRVTLVKLGSVTHARNFDQRFLNVTFKQFGDRVVAAVPSSPNVTLPGYYMLFAFNQNGTPSIASIMLVTP